MGPTPKVPEKVNEGTGGPESGGRNDRALSEEEKEGKGKGGEKEEGRALGGLQHQDQQGGCRLQLWSCGVWSCDMWSQEALETESSLAVHKELQLWHCLCLPCSVKPAPSSLANHSQPVPMDMLRGPQASEGASGQPPRSPGSKPATLLSLWDQGQEASQRGSGSLVGCAAEECKGSGPEPKARPNDLHDMYSKLGFAVEI